MARTAEGDPFELGDERTALAPLARAALWGGLATVAVVVAVVSARSEAGSKRISTALASLGARPVIARNGVEQMQFGVDFGAEESLETARNRWAKIQIQHGPLLEGLRPVVALRADEAPGELQLRLVAGPLADAASAARLCTAVAAAGQPCRPVAFDGQRLALR